jgi:hypothetical protein
VITTTRPSTVIVLAQRCTAPSSKPTVADIPPTIPLTPDHTLHRPVADVTRGEIRC